jgi:tRNA A-37 threonylcarbamoyl transferase component Bud32
MAQVDCPECHARVEENGRFCPYCGAAMAASAAPADPFVGTVVNGKFRVEQLIGQGGMGRVYRAHHLTLDRPVVLKMLHRAYSADPQIVQRFQREARAASRLDHPNSIAVLDFGEAEDGTLFMAMEFLPGKDLGHVVAEEFPLPEERIIRIGAQVLSALAEAHVHGIIHRDLKPENVMVVPRRDNPDFVKVLDFGIAKIVDAGESDPKLTQAGLVCGTPEYMSPEQARGANLDARSDLYSMGVLLYQLCTGDLPFQSDTPVGFLTAHLSSIPVPPRQKRPDLAISPALDALITRALEKDPARRFATADEMRLALLACAPGASAPAVGEPLAPTPVMPARQGRPGGSRTAFWLFALVMVVALAGGGAVVLMVKKTSADRRNFARDPDRPVTATTGAEPRKPPDVAPPRPDEPPAKPPDVAPPRPDEPPAKLPDVAQPQPDKQPEKQPEVTPPQPEKPPDAGVALPAAAQGHARAAALFKQAEARRAAQDVDAAIPLYLAALEADPKFAEVQKKLAVCYQLKGDRKRAAERYRRYLASNPPDADRVIMILSTLE